MPEQLIDQLDEILSDRYCLRCDSTAGTGHDMGGSGLQKDFCSVCWDQRKPLPLTIRRLLEELRERMK